MDMGNRKNYPKTVGRNSKKTLIRRANAKQTIIMAPRGYSIERAISNIGKNGYQIEFAKVDKILNVATKKTLQRP